MDTRQTLNIVDRYFNTFELLGSANVEDYITLLYLMFIDEYYEFNRNVSLQDIDNNKTGLTDCLVRKLNNFLECLKSNSDILQGVELDYLHTKNYWILPDPEDYDDEGDGGDDSGDDEEDNCYVTNNTLYTNSEIINHILYINRLINDNILQL